jgi:hypothetical protein
MKVQLVFRAIPCELTTSYTGLNVRIMESEHDLTYQEIFY